MQPNISENKLYNCEVLCWRVTCNSSVVTVTPAISISPTESSVPQAQSFRSHSRPQPEQAHSFAHALKEGITRGKEDGNDVPKSKKMPQQTKPKEITSASSDDPKVTGAKPLTGKFGFSNMAFVPD